MAEVISYSISNRNKKAQKVQEEIDRYAIKRSKTRSELILHILEDYYIRVIKPGSSDGQQG